MIPAIQWKGDSLVLLDQRALPEEVRYVTLGDFREVTRAIKDMVVRGAPAIGIAGGYAVALAAIEAGRSLDLVVSRDSGESRKRSLAHYKEFVKEAAGAISSARPTAVNLRWACDRVLRKTLAVLESEGPEKAIGAAVSEARRIEEEDVEANRSIARNGATLIKPGSRILTHCNAGALATGGYGTALGVIRKAWEEGKVSMVYADETRPFLQGARLTAWELMEDGIPVTLLVDSAAGHLMSLGRVDVVVVGADRIAMNGDAANKIGTFTLACLARYHRVPFYVAAPLSTFDRDLQSGRDIVVEERPETEVLELAGKRIAPLGVRAFNPAFDITPGHLIQGIITEKGVISPPFRENIPKTVN